MFHFFYIMIFCCLAIETICLANMTIVDEPVTVFVHGTLPPFAKHLVHWLDVPEGLTAAPCIKRKPLIMNRLGYLLNEADPEQFPFDTFYFYGWPGCLSIVLRSESAEDLYLKIRDFKDMTVIGHSHGGTIALELAGVAEKYGDTNFKIKRLVLLGVPMLEITKYYAKSPVFERVYSLYSLGDTTQVSDPQRLYMEVRRQLGDRWHDIPFFSERFLPDYENVVQARVLLHKGNISHVGFIFPSFIRRLPEVLDLLEDVPGGSRVIVNIPRCDKPYFVRTECGAKKHCKRFVRVS
jgi:pimeloyl-ACP methyl ester carboxylesterase